MEQWAAAADGRGWFAEFAAGRRGARRAARRPRPGRGGGQRGDRGPARAGSARSTCRRPTARRTASARSATWSARAAGPARTWTRLEAYAWGWSQFFDLQEQMRAEAERVLPGASAQDAMRHLDEHGEAIDGVEEVRTWLQEMMDRAIADLNGTHFDLADPLKTVEARIAPPGSAAAPYYTSPSQDFSRPGRTWLPTLGQDQVPAVGADQHLVSRGRSRPPPAARPVALPSLPTCRVYQTTVGGVSACSEGWALYAERLMDELGYLSAPGARLGYLDAQIMRAIRVIIDIGMHLGLRIPDESPMAAGQTWTPDARPGVLHRLQRQGPRVPGQRGHPVPERARPGDQLQAGRARLAGRPGRGSRRARGRRTPSSTSRPGTCRRCRSARSASTISPTSWPRSEPCPRVRDSSPRRWGRRSWS